MVLPPSAYMRHQILSLMILKTSTRVVLTMTSCTRLPINPCLKYRTLFQASSSVFLEIVWSQTIISTGTNLYSVEIQYTDLYRTLKIKELKSTLDMHGIMLKMFIWLNIGMHLHLIWFRWGDGWRKAGETFLGEVGEGEKLEKNF